MSQRDAHYGGDLVSGARLLELMGDAATEICIRNDGDEGLLAGYESVEFVAPVYAGDFLEVRAELVRVGRTSREIALEVLRYARPRREESDSAADLVDPPEVVARATGTGVVKSDRQRRGGL
ncbi:MAG: hotdog domain-containing protein [Actinomycetota bacterium]